MSTRLASIIEGAARVVADLVSGDAGFSTAVTLVCAMTAVLLTAVLACLIIPVRQSAARPVKLPGRSSSRHDAAIAHPLARDRDHEVAAIEKLDVSRLVEDRFDRAKANRYLVIDLKEAEAQGRAVIYVQNAVYVYPKAFSPDRTYRVRIHHPATGTFTLNLRVRPRITASRFDAPESSGPYLKVAFSAEAISKYHMLEAIIDEVCDIRFEEALLPAQTAWLAMRGMHPEADINIGALFVLIGVPVTLISTLLCKWLDRMNPDMLLTSAIYLASSLTTLLVVYAVRRHWSGGNR